MARCLRCHREFEPRKAGHVFCSSFCRHRGERQPGDPAPADEEQLARLFAEDRDPLQLVREDDWHPTPDPAWVELDAHQTVEKRRRWYLALVRDGLA